nr:FAD-binding domain-containing protein [Bradyrhizobium sp. NAS96.2]
MDWRAGEQWFWDTLVDADAGSNPAKLAMGRRLRRRRRVFNPILQGEKFDPDGAYVRRWVPELARLSNDVIHQPWAATPIELASAGIELGKGYPKPIVDHKQGPNARLRLTRRSVAKTKRRD